MEKNLGTEDGTKNKEFPMVRLPQCTSIQSESIPTSYHLQPSMQSMSTASSWNPRTYLFPLSMDSCYLVWPTIQYTDVDTHQQSHRFLAYIKVGLTSALTWFRSGCEHPFVDLANAEWFHLSQSEAGSIPRSAICCGSTEITLDLLLCISGEIFYSISQSEPPLASSCNGHLIFTQVESLRILLLKQSVKPLSFHLDIYSTNASTTLIWRSNLTIFILSKSWRVCNRRRRSSDLCSMKLSFCFPNFVNSRCSTADEKQT